LDGGNFVVVVVVVFIAFVAVVVVVLVVEEEALGPFVESSTTAVHSVPPATQTSTVLHDTPGIICSSATQHFLRLLNNIKSFKSSRSQSEG
jgi:hypothetical protein